MYHQQHDCFLSFVEPRTAEVVVDNKDGSEKLKAVCKLSLLDKVDTTPNIGTKDFHSTDHTRGAYPTLPTCILHRSSGVAVKSNKENLLHRKECCLDRISHTVYR